MTENTLYVCDPEKAVCCEKTFCKHNPDAKSPMCEHTIHMFDAKVDSEGNPIVYKRIL